MFSLIAFVVVLILVYIVFGIICGFTFGCLKKKDPEPAPEPSPSPSPTPTPTTSNSTPIPTNKQTIARIQPYAISVQNSDEPKNLFSQEAEEIYHPDFLELFATDNN